MPSAELQATLMGHKSFGELFPTFLAESRLLSVREDGIINIWNLRSESIQHAFRVGRMVRGGGPIRAIALSPNKERLAIGGDRRLDVWSIPSGEHLHSFEDLSEHVSALAWSSDGRMLASGAATAEKAITIWNWRTRTLFLTLAECGVVSDLAFSPARDLLISATDRPSIRLWSPKTGNLIDELCAHRLGINSMSLSGDGKMLASSSEDGSVVFWDMEHRKKVRTVRPSMTCWSIRFSPTGRSLASADQFDGRIRIWDPSTHRPVTVATDEGNFASVCFSPSGRSIATSSNQLRGTIHVWKLND